MPLIATRNPRTGLEDYQFEQATSDELDATCARLRSNQPGWFAAGLEFRVEALNAFLTAVARHREVVFDALKTDTGRVRIANIEIHAFGSNLNRVVADARVMLQDPPERPTAFPHIVGSGQFVPYGLMGNITPWNFPLLLSFLDSWPALLAGNAVVIKPSEVTPRWVEPIRKALAEVPALNDVLAFVCGAGETGAGLIDQVDLVCFTGSVATGRKVAEAAARRFIPAYLELGGKDPAVVLASADVEASVAAILRASVGATGQACQSLERVYVARPIYHQFVQTMAEKARAVTLDLDDESGFIGPFIFKRQGEIVADHLKDAVEKGARILAGGDIISKGGSWLEATVVVDVDHRMKLMTEETFGPVIPIMPFDTIDEAVTLANDSRYGLSAAVFAASAKEAEAVARSLNAGAVSINDGSLTVMVQEFGHEAFAFSGLGPSRSGPEAVLRYVRRKAMIINTVGPEDWMGKTIQSASVVEKRADG